MSRAAISAHELFGVGVAPVENLALIRHIGEKHACVAVLAGMALGIIRESPRRNVYPDAALRTVKAKHLV